MAGARGRLLVRLVAGVWHLEVRAGPCNGVDVHVGMCVRWACPCEICA